MNMGYKRNAILKPLCAFSVSNFMMENLLAIPNDTYLPLTYIHTFCDMRSFINSKENYMKNKCKKNLKKCCSLDLICPFMWYHAV